MGVELSTGGLLGIAVGADLLGSAVMLALAGGPLAYLSWIYDPDPRTALGQLLVPSVVVSLAWLAIVSALGWRRAVGLRRGTLSAWALVPLGALWVAVLWAAGSTEVTDRAADYLVVMVVGLFAAAFLEELVYRGYLLHGFTRRYGGAVAVLVSSGLFAVAHLPAFLLDPEPPLVVLLLVVEIFLFGVAMCRVRAATGSLWMPTAIHALSNVTTAQIIWVPPLGRVDPIPVVAKVLPFALGLLALVELAVRVWRARSRVRRGSIPLAAPPTGANASLGASVGPSHRVALDPASGIERFTVGARRALLRAQEEARREDAAEIGTAHLLLGALHEGEDVVRATLTTLAVDLEPGPALEELTGSDGAMAVALPFSARAQALLLRLRDVPGALGHLYIGTAHLLLSLLREDQAARSSALLASLGIDRARAEKVLLDRLAEQTGAAPDRPGTPPASGTLRS